MKDFIRRLRLGAALAFFSALGLLGAAAERAGSDQRGVGPAPGAVRFAVIGDSGTGDDDQLRIARQMLAWHARWPYQLVLMLGDNIYDTDRYFWGSRRKEFERKFDRPYEPLLKRGVVFRGALGNHDPDVLAGGDPVLAWPRFHIEGPLGYYRFTEGRTPAGEPLLEFFVLNSTRLVEKSEDPAQLRWLENVLAASRAHWRISYFHHPIYSTGTTHGGDERLRAALELLFAPLNPSRPPDNREKNSRPPLGPGGNSPSGSAPVESSPRVHVALAGHDHIYQRFHPQRGVLYFVAGSSGKLRRGDAQPSPQVAATNDRTHTFLLVEATAERLTFWAIDETGRAFDCAALNPAGAVTPLACPASP